MQRLESFVVDLTNFLRSLGWYGMGGAGVGGTAGPDPGVGFGSLDQGQQGPFGTPDPHNHGHGPGSGG
jgi:hypothetical protein